MRKKILMFACLIFFFIGCESDFMDHNGNNQEGEVITILQTGDIHSYLDSHPELFVSNNSIVFRKAGGLANIKTLIDKIRNNNPNGTLLVDGGDLIQGSGESVHSKGKIFPPLIREMKYDVLIPGNWEVVYGKQAMIDVMSDYKTNVIAANMFHKENNNFIFPPYWITEKKGIKIGFIGYNDPEIPIRQNPAFSEGIKFTEIESNLKELITDLKENKKVDVLFLVTHIGISKQVLLSNNPAVEGVDFILGNDTHERIRKPIQGKYANVIEPGAFGSFVGKLDLKIKENKMIGYNYDLIEVNPSKYPPNQKMQYLVDQAKAPYRQEMQQVLGYTSTPIYRYLVVENPMDNMITDALLWKSGADFSVSNGFRFGVPIIPDQTGKKAITKEDLWRMLPVDERIKIGEVTGQQIKDWLEKEINNVFSKDLSKRFGGWLVRFSGMTLKFDSSKETGNRILKITIKGKPLDLNATYKMATFNRTGEPMNVLCRLSNAKNVVIKDYTLHDTMEEYLQANGTVSPKLDGRSIAVDLGTNAFSQLSGTDYVFR
ncbi:bifunctional metallophosphatase/5'-nucleotidase [Chryseobacterium sp.]|uniref:bifunctional metallophosphatase/5'-nucleotidase n=1 Tax=Chryseobacterium sp. TaxID=1871047 RepID=UPI00333EE716